MSVAGERHWPTERSAHTCNASTDPTVQPHCTPYPPAPTIPGLGSLRPRVFLGSRLTFPNGFGETRAALSRAEGHALTAAELLVELSPGPLMGLLHGRNHRAREGGRRKPLHRCDYAS